MTQPVLFDQLNWMGIEERLKRDDRVVVIIGACEQHGYSSVMADVLEPLEIAKAAGQVDPVLIAPPMPYGISPYFVTYPGTISLRVETFAAVVRELLESLVRQGFRRVLVSNGHGGNTGVLSALLVELANAHPEARFELFQWWTHPDVVKAGEALGLKQGHANWSESFPFTRVGPAPDVVETGILLRDPRDDVGQQRDRPEIVDAKQAGPQAVVDIVGIVGNVVGDGRDLGFHRGKAPQLEVEAGDEIGDA